MNYAVKTERAKTEKYVDSASKGMKDCILTSYQNVLNSKDCDKVVFMGVLRGSNLIYKWAEKNKYDGRPCLGLPGYFGHKIDDKNTR